MTAGFSFDETKSAVPRGPAVESRSVFATDSSVCRGDQAIRESGAILVFENSNSRVFNVLYRELVSVEEQT
jgi:hypothetical protein